MVDRVLTPSSAEDESNIPPSPSRSEPGEESRSVPSSVQPEATGSGYVDANLTREHRTRTVFAKANVEVGNSA